MEISPRKPSKQSQEPVDEWLQNEGYFRKHAPRDSTCLFRAVSEQIYMTQHYHIRVRKECVEFMRRMKHLFIENITIPFDEYLEQMTCFTEWGGINEIQAMSLLYKKEFVIFNGQKQVSHIVTNNGFKDMIYLCHTPLKQYESIYSRCFVATAAYCQSIVYQLLYKNVFHMTNIEDTVYKMLHDRNGTFRHDKFFLKGNLEMRDELSTEMYTKVGTEIDDVDDTQVVLKNVPPFPYRIAKALDPNIYRNTDFDIWHEIRKEVKNAGWTRYNSHELQIGGKCLVQINFNEEDFDKANNNSVYISSFEKDAENNTKVVQKKGKQDPAFFYGYIQEMSKNQGPVLVFIEELGEKKVVPYSALKPLPLRKNKQNNWVPMGKKNILLDSNQKWKKTYSSTPRKVKESTSMNIVPNSVDKSGNSDNSVKDINKSNFQWKKEFLNVDQQDYTMEKCSSYPINESLSARNILDNNQSSAVDSIRNDNNKECKGRILFVNKSLENNVIKSSKSDNIPECNNNNNITFNSYSKQRLPKEACYSPYSGNTNAPMSHTLNSVNCSVQKSVDINGSDLPLSDPLTLRFFYNLGLEYFRGNSKWNYLTNGQSSDVGQWYQGVPQSDTEIANTITSSVMQDCTLTQRREHNSDQKETGTPQFVCRENGDKYVNSMTNTHILKTENLKGEHEKDLHPTHDKTNEQESVNKDLSRTNRNSLGSRFKKHSDTRHRSAHHFTQSNNQYSSNGSSNFKPRKLGKEIKDDVNTQHSHLTSQPAYTPTNAINSYQVPYMQQGMYPGLPYYVNDAEGSYYTSNTGFFPMSCLLHSEVLDNNGVQPFLQHLYPGIDYAQAYSGLCPQYMCPQPTPYTIPSQSIQDHWYAVAGQPHYMQYAPVLSVTGEATCNGITQNAKQNASF